jgi:hypothetical protein
MKAFQTFAAIAPAFIFAACAPAASDDRAAAGAPGGEIVRSGCRQGECAWLRVARIETVETRPEGTLRRIDARRGRSVHLDGKIPSKPDEAEIEWEEADRSDFAFCSTRRPAYAFPGAQGGLIVHFLDLFDLGGYQMASASLYMHACHGSLGLPDPKKLRSLGYAPGTRSAQIEDARVEALTDF